MRKKYLSALLFGALLFASAGTFTSCKDYDDDINNLQEQIDAQKSLSEKLTAVESSIAELQKADSDLQTKINAAEEAAEKAALEAQQNAVKEATAQLETVKTELTALINEQAEATNASIESINTEIAKIQGSVQALEKLNSDIEALRTVDANLQASISEIEKTVADNARKIGELQATLEAQEDALELFKAATGENIEALQGDITELQGKIAELAGSDDLRLVSEQLAALQDDFETLSSKVDTISTSLNLLKNAWYTGVTSVSFVVTDGTEISDPIRVGLLSAKSLVTTTFGKGLTGAVDFVKGQRTTMKGSVIVRVSPVTATLDQSSIKFINSKGEESLDGLVKVTEIKPYDKLLTRTTSASGLWEVVLEVADNVDDEFETKFDKATLVEAVTKPDKAPDYQDDSTTGLKDVLFAMKVVDNDQNRGVVSEYNLTFGEEKQDAKNLIDFDVYVGTNWFDITKLHNRAEESEETGYKTPDELVWSNGAQVEVIKEGALKNVKEGDYRQDKGLNGNAVANPIVESKEGSFKVCMQNSGAAYYYITLDKERALSSDDSEILAWNLYEKNIKGINEVYSVKENPEVEIGFTQDINDVLGFRVYAINANGTLQDPDGRAFYVRVGKLANTASASTTIIADANMDSKVESKYVAFDNVAQFSTSTSSIATSEVEYAKVYSSQTSTIETPFKFTFVMTDGTEKDLTYFNGKKLSELAKIKEVYVKKTDDWQWYYMVDDQAYANTISFKDAKGVTIATLNVTITKTLPTTLPADFGWKDQQLSGNVFNCYLWAWGEGYSIDNRDWAPESATDAYMHLDQIFNINTEKSDNKQYTFTFRTDDPKKDIKIAGLYDGEESQFDLKKEQFDMIDCETEYGVLIQYNYGKVSSKDPKTDLIISNTTSVEPQEYKLIYHNLFAEDHYKLYWNSNDNSDAKNALNNIKVGVTPSADFATFIDVDNTIDNAYDSKWKQGTETVKKSLSDLLKGNKYIKIKEAKFVNAGTNVESEYFKAEYTEASHKLSLVAKDVQSQPTASVESQLVLKLVDVFGFEREVRLNITVNPNR